MRLAALASTITITGAVAFGTAALLIPSALVVLPVAINLLLTPAVSFPDDRSLDLILNTL
jgi:hypothetical protein